jgi:hypothetical protein
MSDASLNYTASKLAETDPPCDFCVTEGATHRIQIAHFVHFACPEHAQEITLQCPKLERIPGVAARTTATKGLDRN